MNNNDLNYEFAVYSNLKSNILSKKKNKKKLKIINDEFDKLKKEWDDIKHKDLSIISKDDLRSKMNDNKSIISRNISVNSNNYHKERLKNKLIKHNTNVYENLNNDSSSFSSNNSKKKNKFNFYDKNSIYMNIKDSKKMKSCKKIETKSDKSNLIYLKNVYSRLQQKKNNWKEDNSIVDDTTHTSITKPSLKQLKVKQPTKKAIYNKNYFSRKNNTKYKPNIIKLVETRTLNKKKSNLFGPKHSNNRIKNF